jgi:ArsR family transcriptional regulator
MNYRSVGNIRQGEYVHRLVTNTLSRLERTLQALGDRTRLRLLNLMRQGEICVCYFVSILDEPQPKISRHLAYLRRAGLVEARRDGKWMHDRLAREGDPAVRRIVTAALDALGEDRQMRQDVEALQKTCCAVRLPAELRDAPRPALRG